MQIMAISETAYVRHATRRCHHHSVSAKLLLKSFARHSVYQVGLPENVVVTLEVFEEEVVGSVEESLAAIPVGNSCDVFAVAVFSLLPPITQ